MGARKSAGARPGPTAPTGELAPMDLRELRRHRGRLAAEDDRISYWRSLTSARIAALESESRSTNDLSLDQLVRVLGDTATGHTRRAIQLAVAGHLLPELPTLSVAWTTGIETSARTRAMKFLGVADRSLSAYEAALHDLMHDATRELMLRYREDPTAALDALPE